MVAFAFDRLVVLYSKVSIKNQSTVILFSLIKVVLLDRFDSIQ